MSALLTLIGLGFVLYALYLLYGSSKNKELEAFDGQEFIKEVESFSRTLEKKQVENEEAINNSQTEKYNTPYYKPKKLFIDLSKEDKIDSNLILGLYNQGNSINKIAKETGKSIREVEIILKLYNNK